MAPTPMRSGVVTLLTDFGTRDPYVGVMKGVILARWPDARIVDLTHEVGAQDLAAANFALHGSWPYFPAGTIHVVVVDPEVGSERRILCAQSRDQIFLAPDNGVLTGVLQDQDVIHSVENVAHYGSGVISNTFHGRDVFAPVAARIGTGLDPAAVGPRVRDPVLLARPEPQVQPDGVVVGAILHVDSFGNLISNIREQHLDPFVASGARVTFRGVDLGRPVSAYADVPQGCPLAIMDSFGFLEIAINRGSAARHFNGSVGDPLRVAPA